VCFKSVLDAEPNSLNGLRFMYQYYASKNDLESSLSYVNRIIMLNHECEFFSEEKDKMEKILAGDNRNLG
jgi:hypothetical protein